MNTEPMTFGDLLDGDSFVFDRGIETGLSIDLHKPGQRLHTKRSAHTYYDYDGEQRRIGSIKARVWKVT